MKDANLKLIGKWIIDPEDEESIAIYGNVTMLFTLNGELEYTIYNMDVEQKIFSVYKIEGNYIVTNQPSLPKEEKTLFHLVGEKKLVLNFEGIQSVFLKVE